MSPSESGAADDLLDPMSESGDASVDAVVIWSATAFAPAHHPGKEPASGWLLANQWTTRVSLTETNKAQIQWLNFNILTRQHICQYLADL